MARLFIIQNTMAVSGKGIKGHVVHLSLLEYFNFSTKKVKKPFKLHCIIGNVYDHSEATVELHMPYFL